MLLMLVIVEVYCAKSTQMGFLELCSWRSTTILLTKTNYFACHTLAWMSKNYIKVYNQNDATKLKWDDIYILIRYLDSPGNSSHLLTRCLGNYTVKGGYKDFDLFHSASIEPVIAEAEITGPIVIDDSCR